MNIVLIALLVVVLLAIIVVASKAAGGRTGGETKGNPPYYKKKTLLNEKEQVLYLRLVEALPNCHVMSQVRLADIVGVKREKGFQAWFNKINRKSVDFVICDRAFVVLACMELDGKTHESEDRKKADADKDEALNTAGIPVLRVAATKLPSTEEIKTLLTEAVIK